MRWGFAPRGFDSFRISNAKYINLRGYFSVSFRFPQITEFGKSTAIFPPIYFHSFTQPSDQQDKKIRTICESAARWCGRRARGYRKLISRVNLQYDFNFKM